jgi:mRNA interferase RelE/StbE
LVWTIEFDSRAERDLKRLPKDTQRRIIQFLETRVASNPDPQSLAKPLKGALKNLWRFRVGDYRIIYQIHRQEIRIIVIGIGHRREIYD